MSELHGASFLVTGGTGSFGKAFVDHLLRKYSPRRVAVFSRDELKQYEMDNDQRFAGQAAMRYFIGDVRDRDRLQMAFRGVDYVIHAAALKQVPAAEYNPFECIRTNVYGAENVVQAAIASGVRKVIALSTDKAANPVNLYGASKLAADKIFVAANMLSGADGPPFSVVRYGNVMGSRGSVVPFFRKLVEEGADSLPITDERMTRFWITLRQGVKLVVSALEMMKGGEIYIPKIPSMKMVDLARCLAPDLPHRIVGIRPGEKLHEVMVTSEDSRSTFELADRYVILPSFGSPHYSTAAEFPGEIVPEGFVYSSNSNDDWLDEVRLKAMLSEAETGS